MERSWRRSGAPRGWVGAACSPPSSAASGGARAAPRRRPGGAPRRGAGGASLQSSGFLFFDVFGEGVFVAGSVGFPYGVGFSGVDFWKGQVVEFYGLRAASRRVS